MAQVVAAHFPSLCSLLGHSKTTQFRWPNPMDKVSTLKQKKYNMSLSIEKAKIILVASQIDYTLQPKIVRMKLPRSNKTITYI